MPRPKSDIAPRILAAARQRFLKEGVDGASLRDIAKDAGTSIGMIYYYYATKDDLFLAAIEELYVKLLADLEQALDPKLPVAERLRGLYVRAGALGAEELDVVRILAREAIAGSPRMAAVFERFKRGHIPLVLRTIMDGFADGTFDPRLPLGVVVLSVLALAGPAQAIRNMAGSKLPAVVPSPPELSHLLVEVLLNGVKPRQPG